MEPIKKLFQNDFFSKIQKKKDLIDRYEKKIKKNHSSRTTISI